MSINLRAFAAQFVQASATSSNAMAGIRHQTLRCVPPNASQIDRLSDCPKHEAKNHFSMRTGALHNDNSKANLDSRAQIGKETHGE